MKALSFCLLFTLVIIPFTASAATVKLAWDPNTEEDLAGYKIYYGYTSRKYDTCVDVGNATTAQITSLKDDQTYYFTTTAYNTSGLESGYSKEVSYKTPKAEIKLGLKRLAILLFLLAVLMASGMWYFRRRFMKL